MSLFPPCEAIVGLVVVESAVLVGYRWRAVWPGAGLATALSRNNSALSRLGSEIGITTLLIHSPTDTQQGIFEPAAPGLLPTPQKSHKIKCDQTSDI